MTVSRRQDQHNFEHHEEGIQEENYKHWEEMSKDKIDGDDNEEEKWDDEEDDNNEEEKHKEDEDDEGKNSNINIYGV